MMTERDQDDIVFGRWSSGWDADTDFDALPTGLADITESDVQSADLFQGDGDAAEFEEPLEHFPVFRKALRHFQDGNSTGRVARIDTDYSQGTSEVLGAADAKKQVPISIPEFAQGKVKCWQDGDATIVSIRFEMPDGSPRVATMGARPKVNEEEVQDWAVRAGYDPVTILGALPEMASVATGKRLLRETAAAALEAQNSSEVCGMDGSEPVVIVGFGDADAPLAALMYLQQAAEGGDMQALKELAVMHAAAKTPVGQKVAAPLLAEASRRLAKGRDRKANPTMADRYDLLSAYV